MSRQREETTLLVSGCQHMQPHSSARLRSNLLGPAVTSVTLGLMCCNCTWKHRPALGLIKDFPCSIGEYSQPKSIRRKGQKQRGREENSMRKGKQVNGRRLGEHLRCQRRGLAKDYSFSLKKWILTTYWVITQKVLSVRGLQTPAQDQMLPTVSLCSALGQPLVQELLALLTEHDWGA